MIWKHYVLLAASGLGAAATALLKVDPPHADVWTALIAICGSISLFFGATSPAMSVKAVPPLGVLAILTACVGVTSSACGGATAGLPTQQDFAAYTWSKSTCLQSQSTKADTLLCLHDQELAFCSKFPAVCPTDAGAHE